MKPTRATSRVPGGTANKPRKPRKPPQAAPPPVPERDDVHLAGDRCPFCRDLVRRRAEAWALCERCLARHHLSCWGEAGACAACQHPRPLRRRASDVVTRRWPRWSAPLAGAGLLVLLILGLLAGGRARALAAADAQRATLAALERERAQRAAAQEEALAARLAREEAERREALTRQAAVDQVDRAAFGVGAEWDRAWREQDAADERALGRKREEQRLAEETLARRNELARALRGARELFREGAYEEARQAYERVLELAPERPDVWHERGLVATRLEDHAGAIAACERALALDPALTAALITRGNARRLRGDAAGAKADLSAALERDPHSVTALNNRAVCLHLEGDLQGALADLERALALDTRNPIAFQHRGLVLADLGRTLEAVEDLRRFLHLAPDDEAAPRMRQRLEALFATLSTPERARLSGAPGSQAGAGP